MDLTDLKGVGKKRADLLKQNDIYLPEHILTTFPKRYIHHKISRLDQTDFENYFYLVAKITNTPSVFFIRKNLSKLSFNVIIENKSYSVAIFNQHYLKRTLFKNTEVVIYGKISDSSLSISAQKIYHRSNFKEGYIPVYNLEGIADSTYLKLVKNTYEIFKGSLKDTLPSPLRKRYKLFNYEQLIASVHEPINEENHKQVQRRLKYEELLHHQLRMQYLKYLRKQSQKSAKQYSNEQLNDFMRSLNINLTNAQKREIQNILKDLQSPLCMHRLLQGDTGSGKTLVAAVVAYAAILSKTQVAFMAPTEILARQHYTNIAVIFERTDVNVGYLSNNLSKAEIASVLKDLQSGSIDLLVGTHKLFSNDTIYQNLGLVITDEQHRFGVNQRERLKAKGTEADTLYLSATPIPRTLGKTLFGDMDISVLDERPLSRKDTQTKRTVFSNMNKVFDLVVEKLKNGEQVFVVSPNIEENETLKYSVKHLYKRYKQHFPKHSVAMLHGKLDRDRQETVLMKFKAAQTHILIATTIIEVGIDIPKASTIIIYHAEKMGYAQLHQLRGRVGRGDKDGLCILVHKDDPAVHERLSVMEKTTDGFALSEYDLAYRGHGDLIGTIQSGYLPFQHAVIPEDTNILNVAHQDAIDILPKILNEDPSYKSLKSLLEKDIINT